MKRRTSIILAGAILCGAVLVYATAPKLTISGETIGNGQVLDVIHAGEIDTSGEVVVEGTGDAVFWSLERVVLKPGFRASPTGSGYFNAASESDSNSDGIPDWWVALHNLGSIHGSAAHAGHNMTYLQVFLYGRDPNGTSSGSSTLPTWFVQKQGGSHYTWNPNIPNWEDVEYAGLQLAVSQPGNR